MNNLFAAMPYVPRNSSAFENSLLSSVPPCTLLNVEICV